MFGVAPWSRRAPPTPHYCAGQSPNQGATPNMLAYTYPILGIFWTMLEFFVFILWIWLLIFIFMDIFRSHDMGGLAKALWVIFVIILQIGRASCRERA